jgi:AraC-like DNA-binding protein
MPRETHLEINNLLGRLHQPFTGEVVFDDFHDTVFFIKDAQGHYLVVNETLVTRCGKKNKTQLLGSTSEQVLRPPFGSSFTRQDRQVAESGTPLIGQLELHVFPAGNVGWCITNKYPLMDVRQKTIGIVGVSRDLSLPDLSGEDYESISKAIEYVKRDLSTVIRVSELVELTNLSRFQLDRRMHIVIGLKTNQWILKTRIDLARELLKSSSSSIIEIAHSVGYSDQSAFSRQFRRITGLTPNEYRNLG